MSVGPHGKQVTPAPKLRLATEDDFDNLVEIGRAFHKESGYPQEFDEKVVGQLILNFFKTPKTEAIIIVAVKGDEIIGAIAGGIAPGLFWSELTSTELMWWIATEHRKGKIGLELYSAYEYWAINIAKCKYISSAHLGDPRLDKFFERKGYKKQEQAFIRKV